MVHRADRQQIGRINTAGAITEFAVPIATSEPRKITSGPDGALWFTNNSNNTIGRITTPAPQTITFTSTPPSPAVYGGKYTPAATGGGSGQPVTLSIDPASTAGACSINGSGMVSFTGVGTCVIDANQAGNADYQAAPTAQQTITVPQEAPVLTWPKPGNITLGTALTGTELDATASVPGTFTYSPPAGTGLSLGTHTLTATFTPTNTTNYTGGTVSTQITVVLPCFTCKS